MSHQGGRNQGPSGGVKKYYAVKRGHKTGLFYSWDEVKPLVNGYAKAVHKSFKSYQEAEDWLGGASNTKPSGPAPDARPVYLPTMIVSTAGRSSSQSHSSSLQHSQQPGAHGSWPHPVASCPYTETRPLPHAHSPGSSLVREGPFQAVDPAATYRVEFDGASKGNPGRAGSGAQIVNMATRQVVATVIYFLGTNSTNNEAEYQGLITGLQFAKDLGIRKVVAQGDSQLVCRQVTGAYKVNQPHLQLLHSQVIQLSSSFQEFSIRHVLREFNSEADALSNLALTLQ